MAKRVDARDLKSLGFGHAGSSPAVRTMTAVIAAVGLGIFHLLAGLALLLVLLQSSRVLIVVDQPVVQEVLQGGEGSASAE